MQTLELLKHRVTWLPEMAIFQTSFNKQYGRMYLTYYLKDKKAHNNEVLSMWGLKPLTKDSVFQYFATPENIEKYHAE